MTIDHIPYAIGSRHWPGLSKVVEEMGEALQVLGKILGTGGEAEHWDGTNLRERVDDELADVDAAIKFFRQANAEKLPPGTRYMDRVSDKLSVFWEWHEDQLDRDAKAGRRGHPMVDGKLVLIGDQFTFEHPDKADETVVVTVSSLYYDSTEYDPQEGPLGWVVTDLNDDTVVYPIDEVIRRVGP